MDSIINAASQCNAAVTWTVFIGGVTAFFCWIIILLEIPDNSLSSSKTCVVALVISLVAAAVAVGATIIGCTTLSHCKDELSSEITREYNVKMASPDKFDFKSLDEPIEVNSLDEGDTRIYECYIKKNQDGQYKLYTKSDKGAYMELSGASKAMLAE